MSATRLTETQWMVLSAASQRDDHCAMLEAAQKVVKKLIDLGLVEAGRARGDLRQVTTLGPQLRPLYGYSVFIICIGSLVAMN